MPKFIYKFESIKKIKETFEKQVQKEISLIDNDILRCTGRLNDILTEIQKTRDSVSCGKNIKASELHFLNNVEYLLELDVKKIQTEIEKLEKLRTTKMNELIEKSKEHKIFETLEGKYQEDFISELNQIEQKNLDEMAVTKYIREE